MKLCQAVYRYRALGDLWIVLAWQPNQQLYFRTKYAGYWGSLIAVLYKRFLLLRDTDYRNWR